MGAVQPTLLDLLPAAPMLPTKKAAARRKRRPRPTVAATAPVEYATGVDAEGNTTWTLRFPAPAEMLSVNGNPHWRRTSPVRKTWREAVFVHAKAAKLPVGLAKVRIDVQLRFPTNGRRDAANYHSNVIKPLVDAYGPSINTVRAGRAIVAPGYGLIADDTAEFLEGPFVVLGPKVADPKACPFGEVLIKITELEPAP
jgi:hypothetical protein